MSKHHNKMTPLQKLAREYADYFETGTRPNDDTFLTLKVSAPEELINIMLAVDDEMMPDDYKYEYVENALDELSYNDPDEIELEADTDIVDLCEWLKCGRCHYTAKAVDAFGLPRGFSVKIAMMQGQLFERLEVLAIVRGALEKILKERRSNNEK